MMNKLGTSLALATALLGAVVAAHAAPSAPEPAPKLRPGLIPTPAVSAITMKAEALPATGKCGEPVKQQVKLTNKTLKPWTGTVSFSGTGGTKEVNASVPSGETKIIDVWSFKGLDCTKPLGVFGIRVWNETPATVWYTKVIKPTTVKAEQGFNAPPSNDPQPQPWLRRVWLDGTCGGQIIGKMGLHTFSQQAQPAKVKLALGPATKDESVQVVASNTFVTVETPLDCQAQTGILVFDYALLDGKAASGKLPPVYIGLEPQS